MRIEIAEPGRMTQSGSSLLRLIQNNNMPVLDLLVRESIQNSLDARKPNSKYVDVNFITGEFNSKRLSSELEGITRPLRKRFPETHYSFIAVRDSQTVGLTGEMNYKKVRDNNYGNLLKLIYEICKPQEAEGAGGSWGLGKTVYFRIGIGLVVYYSRIKSGNKYESRLAASYVEDEHAKDAMIPVYEKQAKRGIAWWGDAIGENITQPVTDENYISDFLRIFKMKPYSGDETGTTIVIPYIDSEMLLSNNQIEYLDSMEQPIVPYWCADINSYFAVAAQRWYAPRLNNKHYTNGAYLRLFINGKGLAHNSMEPAFKVIQALYNRAHYVKEKDIFAGTESEVKVEPVKINKYLNDTVAGTVAFAKIPKYVLGMEPPTNKPEPYMYYNCEVRDEDVNKPTVCYTRSPAMIVAYENVGNWTSSIAATSKDEYIIAVFALNSWNEMKNSPVERTLEEYIRKCEMADHTSWSDWSEGKYNPRIVTKLQGGVNRIISKEFAPTEDSPKPKENSGLGKLFGEMLLPPEGFGKKPSPPVPPGPPPNPPKRSGVVFRTEPDKIKYFESEMILPLVLETSGRSKLSKAIFEIQIDSESKRMSVQEWESKLGLKTPFAIKRIDIDISAVNGKQVKESTEIADQKEETAVQGIRFSKTRTEDGTCFGIVVESEPECTAKTRIAVTLAIYRRDVKPAFVFTKEETDG